jgi:hypothetical protein
MKNWQCKENGQIKATALELKFKEKDPQDGTEEDGLARY